MKHLDDGILQAWLDGPRSGLSRLERDGIELHLSECERCARRLEEMEGETLLVNALLSGAGPEEEVTPPFEDVLARARRGEAGRRRRTGWTRAGWAASVVAAGIVGWMANGAYTSDTLSRGASETRMPAATEASRGQASLEEEATTVAKMADEVDAMASLDAEVDPDARVDPTDLPASPARVVVRGTVTDEDGSPLQGAQVVAEDTRVRALTGPDGRFELALDSLSGDSLGRDLTLMANLVGFRPERRALAIGSEDTVAADFRLGESVVALERLAVTGAPAESRAREAEGVPARAAQPMAEPGVSTDALADAASSAWRPVTRAQAEAEVGFPLLTVPDLPVVRIEVESTGEPSLVRVLQNVGDGLLLEMVQGVGTGHAQRLIPPEGGSRASAIRRQVLVVAVAPVPLEVLEDLLDRIR